MVARAVSTFEAGGHHEFKYGWHGELGYFDQDRYYSGPAGSRGLVQLYPGAGGDIFRIANQRMKLRRGCVGQKLKRRIQSLCRPDDRDRQNDPAPIRARDAEEQRRNKNRYCSGGVNPRIMLAANHTQYATCRMIEAADATRELERTR